MASKCLPSIGLPQVWLLCGGFYVWLLSAPVASMFGFCVASMVALCGFLWLRHVASKCLCGFYVWHLCGMRAWLLVAATRGFDVSLWLPCLASIWHSCVASYGCDKWLLRVFVASMSGFYVASMCGFVCLAFCNVASLHFLCMSLVICENGFVQVSIQWVCCRISSFVAEWNYDA
jgi:hypothetical protein